MTKKERQELRIQEASKKNKKKKRKIFIGSSLLVAIFALVLVWFFTNQKPLPGEKVEVMDNQNHISNVNEEHEPYNTNPPTSGPHTEQIGNWGVYKETLPKEVLVHNLEDGGVVIYYNDKLDKESVTILENIVKLHTSHVVLNPDPKLKDTITLTAWGRMDKMDNLNEKRVEEFINAFKGVDHH